MALPRTSLTKEALAQDDEYVAEMMRSQPPGADDDEPVGLGPRLVEFSPEVEALYAVIDRLADVITVQQAMGGQKPKRIAPLRRPQTAYDRYRDAKWERNHRTTIARLLPNGPQELPESG